jgi:pimeloyl-ACP methyl ester carboxylesterase
VAERADVPWPSASGGARVGQRGVRLWWGQQRGVQQRGVQQRGVQQRRVSPAVGLVAGLGLTVSLLFGGTASADVVKRKLDVTTPLAASTPGRGQAASALLHPCQLRGVAVPALCGVLDRPLDPANPQSPRIGVHVAVLPALARQKKADPVFFLAGGPGQSAIDLAPTIGQLLARFSNRRDIVLVDQRGTGRSAPLVCADDDAAAQGLGSGFDQAGQLQRLAECRRVLQQKPYGDLRQFTTTLAMQDLDAVRQAIDAEQINLVGVSYGTRAALEYLRQFPRAVRRVVLDGVAPPDMVLPLSARQDTDAALQALFDWCAGDARCSSEHPGLAKQWQALRVSLPRTVQVPHPVTGRPEVVTVDAAALNGLVRGPLYAPVLASALPMAIEAAAAGRWTPLAGLALAFGAGSRRGSIAQGMHFSVLCAEDVPLLPPAGAGPVSGADEGVDLYRQACADWPQGSVPPAFYRVPVATSPVLLLSGALDPATPPRHAARVAQALGAQAQHIIVAQAGHGVMGLPCLRELVFRFVDAPDDEAAAAVALGPEAACASQVPRPPSFRPPDPAGAVKGTR